MSQATPLILIGTGEYYRKLLIPALALLKTKGLAYLLLTVDVKERGETGNESFDVLEHRTRMPEEPLRVLLKDVLPLEPTVILGHANQMHVKDAQDLVNSGFRVLIEKPFALSSEELSVLEVLINTNHNKVGLLEYYLSMKSAPLYALTGQLKPTSFFFNDGLIEVNQQSKVISTDYSLWETFGGIKSVLVEILEGEGSVGKLDQRGSHLIAKKFGGGMIQDLGIHALAPLVSIEQWIGEISSKAIGLKTAHSREYLAMAKAKYNLEPDEIAESYAEIALTTSLGIPITVRVGKYVLNNKNRRMLKIVGENGEIRLDLSNPSITVKIGEEEFPDIYALPKTEEKYYSVIRSSLLELAGESPFTFSINKSALEAQALVLEALQARESIESSDEYDSGANPDKIF